MGCHTAACCCGQYNLERGCQIIAVLGLAVGTASLIYWCVHVQWFQIIACAFFTVSAGLLLYGVM